MILLNKLLRLFSVKDLDEKYPYLIEIRPMLEKYRIKKETQSLRKVIRTGRWHRVPHITLVYSFKLKEGVKEWHIAKIIQNIISKYDVVKFWYDGFEIRKSAKGYVFAFKIKPSHELKKLRKEIYDQVKSFIKERPDVVGYNDVNEDNFWFHATVGYRLSEKDANLLKNEILNYKYYFPAFALRITLIKKSKIKYECDIPTRRILSRKEALSKKYYAKMVRMYRKILQIESPLNYSFSDENHTWFISDTHFDHANIIKYCARPFVNVKEMNRTLLQNWNSLIKKNDVVYFLGDISFGKHSRGPSYWLRRLNGKIIYIKGNHEKFEAGKDYEILEYQRYRFLLIHNPDSVGNFDGWIVHGHKHNNDLINYPFINKRKRTINVSVEVINYKPISLNQILKLCSQDTKRIETV